MCYRRCRRVNFPIHTKSVTEGTSHSRSSRSRSTFALFVSLLPDSSSLKARPLNLQTQLTNYDYLRHEKIQSEPTRVTQTRRYFIIFSAIFYCQKNTGGWNFSIFFLFSQNCWLTNWGVTTIIGGIKVSNLLIGFFCIIDNLGRLLIRLWRRCFA